MVLSAEEQISIIVVGGGIGGLTFAVEAHRKGHKVQVFERRADATAGGESILVSSSALPTLYEWPGFEQRIVERRYEGTTAFKKSDGELIAPFVYSGSAGQSVFIYRYVLHKLLLDYAIEQGINVELNSTGSEFFESGDQAGIILKDGRKFTADLVIASDGIGSKSWPLFAKSNSYHPVSSGFVLYRRTYHLDDALKNPVVARAFQQHEGDFGYFYVGPDSHCLVYKVGVDVGWMLTCRDENSNAEESWSKPTSTARAIEVVKDWEPLVPEVIKATPDGSCFDWKMMWRDPQPQWVSDGGRIVQLGDAAHPFLPTSGSGATMAIEDSWSLAACLEIGGKANLTLATRVHNKLRFERVSCAQKLGLKNRELLHKTDWNYVKQHPEVLGSLYYKKWINEHNPAKYAVENYNKCAEHILEGKPFENTNYVPGYKYKPWTVRDVLELSTKGERIVDEGDW
ncbi:hypothetical protein ACN47E_001860 [Coniothyrium glycines]